MPNGGQRIDSRGPARRQDAGGARHGNHHERRADDVDRVGGGQPEQRVGNEAGGQAEGDNRGDDAGRQPGADLNTDTPAANPTTRASAANASAPGTAGNGSIDSTIDTPHRARNSPAMQPAAARSVLSTSDGATRRERPAPSAARTIP